MSLLSLTSVYVPHSVIISWKMQSFLAVILMFMFEGAAAKNYLLLRCAHDAIDKVSIQKYAGSDTYSVQAECWEVFNSSVSHLNLCFCVNVAICHNCGTLRKMYNFISICISILNFEVFKMDFK